MLFRSVATSNAVFAALIRSVKYFIALCVLYLIIMALMLLTNTSVLTPSETFSALVRSTRGQVLIVAVVLLSALYPKFGFIRRQEIGSLRKNREQILVQELRKQRKRPNRYDEVGLFSGILFCADCGSVMYQQRYQTDKRKQDCISAATTRNAPMTVRRTLSAPTS